ncbi:MAG: hypothetical protein AVDCRST_MAG49-3046 [uncultured Thermomicrobiales bacterium]|uniref:Uncharacterized protein n=1 Tax=uncultured Thermomicrobiales bacterium TaxID=1645740 RepID=A0A6J4V1M5_9BACT|nr:MAG: hypothetical protein AVDCRST_MAG49-3046 [uncultured Thermomicrobiales bacterium]
MEFDELRRQERLSPLAGQVGGESQRAGVLGGRFPVRAEPGGAPGRGGGILENRRPVRRHLCVMGQPRQVVREGAPRPQCREHRPVQRGGPHRRDGVEDHRPREFVPEHERRAVGAQQPGRQALVDRVDARSKHRRQQPGLGGRADRRGGLQRRAANGRQPRSAGQHGVPDGRREARRSGREDLGHVERVAAGEPIESRRVDRAAGGEGAHGRLGQRRQRQPAAGRRGGEVAQDDPERVLGPDLVVAVGDDQQRADPAQPPAEEAEQVERGLVGPVGVLDHRQRRGQPGAELGQGRPEDPVARRVLGQQPVEPGAGRRRDVAQRPERRRRREGVARPHQHPRPPPRRLAEAADERGLADPGLPGHEREAPLAGRGLPQPPVERPELPLPLQKVHRPTIGALPTLSRGWLYVARPCRPGPERGPGPRRSGRGRRFAGRVPHGAQHLAPVHPTVEEQPSITPIPAGTAGALSADPTDCLVPDTEPHWSVVVAGVPVTRPARDTSPSPGPSRTDAGRAPPCQPQRPKRGRTVTESRVPIAGVSPPVTHPRDTARIGLPNLVATG